LQAVSELVVPVDAGIYSVMGLERLQEMVELVKRHLAHPDLAITTLVLSRVMTNLATRELETQLRETYGKLVAASAIPDSVQVEKAAAHHRTVLEYPPKCSAALASEGLVAEVLNHGRKRGNAGRTRQVNGARSKRRAG
jgi:cellulose biosynthesis protein BcsQ